MADKDDSIMSKIRKYSPRQAEDVEESTAETRKHGDAAAKDFKEGKYDTILMLMNGIGVTGKLSNLTRTLEHAKRLLNKGGSIYCDSSDVKYLYEEEDGSYWMDLVSEYYGNFRFQMSFKQAKSAWFDWLYIDYDSLHKVATEVGFTARKIYEEDNHFLAELTLN
jgi:hypothetical protein